jgi:hypothetical protein
MNDQTFRHLRLLLPAVTLALMLAGCGDGKSPTAVADTKSDGLPLADSGVVGRADDTMGTIAPGEPNPATPQVLVEDLVAQLNELGVEAIYNGQSLEQSFFFPGTHIVTINGQDVRIFAYDTVAALKEDATKVSLDGGTVGLASVRWMAPPHFYARSIFLALYVGRDAEITRALESVFGAPFAGEGAQAPDIVIDPGVGSDRLYLMETPALIVVSNAEDLERLLPYLSGARTDVDWRAVDLAQNWIVAVFRGAMPTAGYGVEIEAVRLDASGQVLVEISLAGPGVDDMVAQVITHPMDVRVVPRAGLESPTGTGWWAQTADGRVLARFGEAAQSGVDPLPADGEPFRLPDIRGAIAEVEVFDKGTAEGALARILIEGPGTDDTLYDVAWVEIMAATAISFDGETFAPPTLADLAPGRQVQVIFTGPVRESYPVQAVAGQVLIYR